ncbi:hypothetical protein E1293_04945 [Actinomadura darangshiensis]|uniref:Uncharacterized protein n=1 Tax=Actinomadura darangshiensis TaxID=705336 RepID=A0A4V2YXJ3_9ACTN|nr:hypothetical protein [Actinomadura darangshiensis]TDD89287.1 hypothetical protein E1293_04945 [Actinomadura darangshiensis]
MTDFERILARVFVEIVISIDLSDDDDIDPDVATGLLEPVAALLQEMPRADRRRLTEFMLEYANDEANAERSATALDLPTALGLVE